MEGTAQYVCDVSLISRKALDVFFSKLPQTPISEMESRLGRAIFSKVPVLRVKGENGDYDYESIVSETYADDFKKLQKGDGCTKVVLTAECGGSKKTMGYSVFYIYKADLSRTVFAFIHKDAGDGKVAMIETDTPQKHAAAMVCIISSGRMTPFSKFCCECGQADGNLMKCGCRKVRYCGKDCQTAHWGAHRAKCALGAAKV